ncbi:hypothetical protein ZIOFF_049489 [Zingiber officinale]|uniref:Uncharacterized protein n=1 Tax=Zingiber officinale TaxID=94328 RepID=A0A8J5KTB1_ZINOF|nr:hypothetical protein ZIOFF_049489 [Zingiber officinale]
MESPGQAWCLGNIYMDCNMMSVAASFYKATLAVTTGISTPFNNLAIIYKQQGNYAEAIACYNEVLRRLLLMVLSIEGTRWHQRGLSAGYSGYQDDIRGHSPTSLFANIIEGGDPSSSCQREQGPSLLTGESSQDVSEQE